MFHCVTLIPRCLSHLSFLNLDVCVTCPVLICPFDASDGNSHRTQTAVKLSTQASFLTLSTSYARHTARMFARSREEQEELEAEGLIEVTATTTDSVSEQIATSPGRSTQDEAASDLAQAEVTTETTGIDYGAPTAPLSSRPITNPPLLRSWASHSSLGDAFSPAEHYTSDVAQTEVANSDQTEDMDIDDEAAPARLSDQSTTDRHHHRRWASHSSIGDIPSQLQEYSAPERAGFGDNSRQQTTAPPEPLLTFQWRLDGRPPCPECGGFHPPPCNPSLAKRRHIDNVWKAIDPRGFANHKRWRERKPKERYGSYPPWVLHRANPDLTPMPSDRHVESTQSVPVEDTQSTPIVPDPRSDIVPVATLEPHVESMLRITANPMSLEELQELMFDPRVESLPGAPEIIMEIIQGRTVGNEVAWEDAPQAAWEDAPGVAPENVPDAPEDAQDASQDAPQDAPEAAAGVSTGFRTGSERALHRDLASGQGQTANAAGKQAKR
jgi:hypothetical protein